MPQTRTTGKKVLYSLITVLIVLLSLELGLHITDFVVSRVKRNPAKIPFRGLYQDEEWAATLARESDNPHRDQK